jgi:cyclopropane-fatty-acyl-phospholipid synthase
MWEFYLISAEMMFRTGSQLVFHMQLARRRDAAPIVRDYVTETQARYRALEPERLSVLKDLRGIAAPKAVA